MVTAFTTIAAFCQRARAMLTLTMTLAVLGCKHAPPYPRGQPPAPEVLLQSAQPVVSAITVSEAKVVADRLARADLAFLAEAPSRFRATISKSGNELVSLAFHEQGYTLRYKLEQMPQGFYAGPATSTCAVAAVLGVPLSYDGLVTAVLGGAPLLTPPFDIVAQRWDGRDRTEQLVLANDRFVQELEFTWIAGHWRFEGAQLWPRTADGSTGRRLWRLDHDDFERVGDVVLPEKTIIHAPGRRRDHRVAIVYDRRELDPAFARQPATTGPAPTGVEPDPWADDGAWETTDDATTDSVQDFDEAPPGDNSASIPDPVGPPELFTLQPAGLGNRGDLCR